MAHLFASETPDKAERDLLIPKHLEHQDNDAGSGAPHLSVLLQQSPWHWRRGGWCRSNLPPSTGTRRSLAPMRATARRGADCPTWTCGGWAQGPQVPYRRNPTTPPIPAKVETNAPLVLFKRVCSS